MSKKKKALIACAVICLLIPTVSSLFSGSGKSSTPSTPSTYKKPVLERMLDYFYKQEEEKEKKPVVMYTQLLSAPTKDDPRANFWRTGLHFQPGECFYVSVSASTPEETNIILNDSSGMQYRLAKSPERLGSGGMGVNGLTVTYDGESDDVIVNIWPVRCYKP